LLNINCPDAASAVLCVAEQELDGPKIAGAPISTSPSFVGGNGCRKA
jgi:hypothetical protein